jgi:F-type H+-transporting ATPase subunit b
VSIDWVTVGAQILNFLVLVWLLKRFLYGPVVRAMDRREAEIQRRDQEAEERAATAAREAQEYHARRLELEQARDQRLAEVGAEVDRQRAAMTGALREEIAELRRKWMAQLEREQDATDRTLRREVAGQFVAQLRRALTDLAGAPLEARMAEVFIERLARLDAPTRERIGKAALADGRVRVRTSLELPAELRKRMTAAVRSVIGSDVGVEYEPCSDGSCGIELAGGGQSLVWTIDGYVDGLESGLRGAVAELRGRRGAA